MESIFFNLFSILLLLSALAVIFVKNPVHSVLFLMLVFVNASGLLILLGTDFLALIFIMVYVGAIAVLFLFVIMMLNIKMIEWTEFLYRYLPMGVLLWVMLIIELYWLFQKDFGVFSKWMIKPELFNWLDAIAFQNTLQVIGNLTYTVFSFEFVLASLVLLVAMVGAIVLTMYSRSNLRRQSIIEQTKQDSLNALRFYQ